MIWQPIKEDIVLRVQVLQEHKGIQGNKGDKGDAATVAVSSTVTLAPGSQAKVENEGDSHNAKFKFSIPRGDR